MSEYILILIWFLFVVFITQLKEVQRVETVNNKSVKRYKPWFAFLVFLPIIIMAGNRGWFVDTGTYIRSFRNMPSSLVDIPSYIRGVKKDQGFYGCSAVLKTFIGNDYVVYLTIIALIQGCAIIKVFRKYSIDYALSVFLFVVSTDYISWMYNGIRQFTAVTIIFAATPLMLKKKYLSVLAIIWIASTMHQSALIMIPLVLIAQGKAWNKKTLAFIVGALLAITFIGQFTNILDSALSDTQYVNVVSDYTSWEDDGTNPLRVLIYSIPAILSFFGRRDIRRLGDPIINFCTNMSIISMGLYIISMFTSGIFMGRLPIYISLYGYILLPWEMKNLFTQQSKRIVYIGLVGFYLLFYYFQMHMIWGLF